MKEDLHSQLNKVLAAGNLDYAEIFLLANSVGIEGAEFWGCIQDSVGILVSYLNSKMKYYNNDMIGDVFVLQNAAQRVLRVFKFIITGGLTASPYGHLARSFIELIKKDFDEKAPIDINSGDWMKFWGKVASISKRDMLIIFANSKIILDKTERPEALGFAEEFVFFDSVDHNSCDYFSGKRAVIPYSEERFAEISQSLLTDEIIDSLFTKLQLMFISQQKLNFIFADILREFQEGSFYDNWKNGLSDIVNDSRYQAFLVNLPKMLEEAQLSMLSSVVLRGKIAKYEPLVVEGIMKILVGALPSSRLQHIEDYIKTKIILFADLLRDLSEDVSSHISEFIDTFCKNLTINSKLPVIKDKVSYWNAQSESGLVFDSIFKQLVPQLFEGAFFGKNLQENHDSKQIHVEVNNLFALFKDRISQEEPLQDDLVKLMLDWGRLPLYDEHKTQEIEVGYEIVGVYLKRYMTIYAEKIDLSEVAKLFTLKVSQWLEKEGQLFFQSNRYFAEQEMISESGISLIVEDGRLIVASIANNPYIDLKIGDLVVGLDDLVWKTGVNQGVVGSIEVYLDSLKLCESFEIIYSRNGGDIVKSRIIKDLYFKAHREYVKFT